ncbi:MULTISPECIES: polyphenol oxidase family protein [Aminobacterium]|jgi:hypothetical protein|uniref:polyphenol oxidase family protein n=1 Tax=Aminobacterium TaxID=81466 RepID=UPI00257C02C2|nr:polyphenol oxidase family protein [Aminobacterium sp. UBA4987]
MTARNFSLDEKEGHYILEYLCPEERAFFKARLFMKGSLIGKAMGDPALSRKAVASLSKEETSQKKLLAPKQIHGTRILTEKEEYCLPERPFADGIFLKSTLYEGSLRFADCVPVILASPVPHPWLMLLHSGFKGTVQNIVRNSLVNLDQKMNLDFNRIYAWIGPGISKTFYFRKDDEWSLLGQKELSSAHWQKEGERVYFDLPGALESQLLENELLEGHITTIPLCSYKDQQYCYSYRRKDIKERMFLLASLIIDK